MLGRVDGWTGERGVIRVGGGFVERGFEFRAVGLSGFFRRRSVLGIENGRW